MPSALDLVSNGVNYMDLHTGIAGAAGVALDTLAGGGASYAIGQMYGRNPDKWHGKHAATLFAIGGKALAIGIQLVQGPGARVLSGVADSVGQAGVDAIALRMGIHHGMKAAGRKAVLLPKGTDPASLPAGAGRDVLVGAGERALTFDQIEAMAAMR